MRKNFIFFIAYVSLLSCTNKPSPSQNSLAKVTEELVPTIEYSLIKTSPHDTLSFTEGFLFHNGQLFESTGSPENFPGSKSIYGIVDLKTGKIEKKAELDHPAYFGEGIVIINNKVFQLTYKNQIGFIYDAKTYKLLGRFNYTNKEGWGLTTDGTSIIMSDGTNTLTYLDPQTLKATKTINVTNGGYAEDYLNELEFIKGFIYANVWMKNYIVKINPETGKVMGIINLSYIMSDAKSKNPNADVLNGIAYDALSNKIYVTGKLFSNIYEIAFPI